MIPKEKLDQAPEEERLTYLMAGNLANDLLILQKLLIMSSRSAADMGEPHSTPINGSTLLLAKLLAGRLYEGWNWLRGVSTKNVRIHFAQDKDGEAFCCYRQITDYFGRDNIIEALRQKVGFHADVEAMRSGYALLVYEPVTEYLSDQRGNSFFASADTALIGTVCHLARTDDVVVGLGRVADELAHVASLFGDLCNQIAMYFCIDLLDVDAQDQLENFIELDVPLLDDLRLPFFTDSKPPNAG
jgi:hypothetical protein